MYGKRPLKRPKLEYLPVDDCVRPFKRLKLGDMPTSAAGPCRNAVQTPLPPAPTLDHRMYPHIFDLIMSFASRQSLFALRRTCWALCYTIDVMLSRHILLDPQFLCSEMWYLGIGTPDGRLPLAYAVDADSDCYSFRPMVEYSKAIARAAIVFSGTRVVEVLMDLGSLTEYESYVLGLFTDIAILKVHNGSDGLCYDLCGHFGSAQSLKYHQHVILNPDGWWWLRAVQKQPERLKRLTVLVQGYCCMTPDEEYLPPIPHVDSLRDIVLIFDDTFDEVVEMMPRYRIRRHQLGFLTNLFEEAIPHLGRVRYTLVGLVPLPYGVLGQVKTKRSKVKRKFYRRLRNMLRQRYPDSEDEVNTRLAAVTIITHDAYEDAVGRGQFAWETDFEEAEPDDGEPEEEESGEPEEEESGEPEEEESSEPEEEEDVVMAQDDTG